MGSNLGGVNIPGIVAGVLALVSIFSPWWGVVTTVSGFSSSLMYGLFSSPSQGGQQLNSNFTQFMNSYTPIVLALVLVTIALAFIGSFTPTIRPLGAGLFLSISSLVGYAVLVSYGLSQNCQGNNCVRGITGSSSFFNITTTWGFQTGFYLFIAATVTMIVALAYHHIIRPAKRSQ
jgi:hypothetical protein